MAFRRLSLDSSQRQMSGQSLSRQLLNIWRETQAFHPQHTVCYKSSTHNTLYATSRPHTRRRSSIHNTLYATYAPHTHDARHTLPTDGSSHYNIRLSAKWLVGDQFIMISFIWFIRENPSCIIVLIIAGSERPGAGFL